MNRSTNQCSAEICSLSCFQKNSRWHMTIFNMWLNKGRLLLRKIKKIIDMFIPSKMTILYYTKVLYYGSRKHLHILIVNLSEHIMEKYRETRTTIRRTFRVKSTRTKIRKCFQEVRSIKGDFRPRPTCFLKQMMKD